MRRKLPTYDGLMFDVIPVAAVFAVLWFAFELTLTPHTAGMTDRGRWGLTVFMVALGFVTCIKYAIGDVLNRIIIGIVFIGIGAASAYAFGWLNYSAWYAVGCVLLAFGYGQICYLGVGWAGKQQFDPADPEHDDYHVDPALRLSHKCSSSPPPRP